LSAKHSLNSQIIIPYVYKEKNIFLI
jgi:hypothetical protein